MKYKELVRYNDRHINENTDVKCLMFHEYYLRMYNSIPKKYINKIFEIPYIYSSPYFTIDMVEKYKIEWNWHIISQHKNITWDIIKSNPDYPWVWKDVSSNPNITWDIIRDNPEIKWDWKIISRRKNITWDIIRSNSDYPWVWKDVSLNPNITWDIIKSNPQYEWYITDFSGNKNFTYDNLKEYQEKKIQLSTYVILRNNTNIPIEELVKLADKKDCDNLSFNPNITIDIIKQHPHGNWNIYIYPELLIQNIRRGSKIDLNHLHFHELLTLKHIFSNLDLKWDWKIISSREFITWDIVSKYPQIPWNYKTLSSNPNINLSIVKNNPDMPWDYINVLNNPSVTYDDIKYNLEEWMKPYLRFLSEETLFKKKYQKRFKYLLKLKMTFVVMKRI
jgi:hypothetical protein